MMPVTPWYAWASPKAKCTAIRLMIQAPCVGWKRSAHCIFDSETIERLRHIFSKVCTDFAAVLVQLDGESDHVHLVVNYPPKVSVSSLVNSLKGVSSYVLRRQLPRAGKYYWKNVLWSPSYFAASCGGARSTSSNATSSSRPHRHSRGLPWPEVRGLRHSPGVKASLRCVEQVVRRIRHAHFLPRAPGVATRGRRFPTLGVEPLNRCRTR